MLFRNDDNDSAFGNMMKFAETLGWLLIAGWLVMALVDLVKWLFSGPSSNDSPAQVPSRRRERTGAAPVVSILFWTCMASVLVVAMAIFLTMASAYPVCMVGATFAVILMLMGRWGWVFAGGVLWAFAWLCWTWPLVFWVVFGTIGLFYASTWAEKRML